MFDPEAVLIKHYNPAILAIQKIEKPLLAAMNGLAVGAGASLALACDFRLLSDNARMALLFTRIGLVPDAGASYFLPRLIGVTRAHEIMMLGEDILPDKALDWGLVHRVFRQPTSRPRPATSRSVSPNRPAPPGMVKRQMRKTMVLNLPEQLNLEAKMQGEAGRTDDFAEGVTAFLEKRPARFAGR